MQRAILALIGVLAVLTGAVPANGADTPAASMLQTDTGTEPVGGLLDRGWSFFQHNGLCILEQRMPDYGVVRFMGHGGADLSFELTPHRDLFAAGPVSVRRVAPPWHDGYPQRDPLGEATHLPSGVAVSGDALAGRLVLNLGQGYAIELHGPGRYDSAAFVVVLSPLHFQASHAAFSTCLKRDLSWAQMQRSRILYPEDEWSIAESDLTRLELLADYASADSRVVQVFVDGHTDDTGGSSDNLMLSRRRAEAVASFLAACGVVRERIVVRYHGDRYPVAPNDSDVNRAANRRTTVRLSREPGSHKLVQR